MHFGLVWSRQICYWIKWYSFLIAHHQCQVLTLSVSEVCNKVMAFMTKNIHDKVAAFCVQMLKQQLQIHVHNFMIRTVALHDHKKGKRFRKKMSTSENRMASTHVCIVCLCYLVCLLCLNRQLVRFYSIFIAWLPFLLNSLGACTCYNFFPLNIYLWLEFYARIDLSLQAHQTNLVCWWRQKKCIYF